MSTINWNEGGRQLTLINRTAKRVGACGVVIGPFLSVDVPLRKVLGHKSYMSSLSSLKASGVLDVQLNLDILNVADLDYLDAPLSGDIQMSRDVFNDVLAIDRNGFKASFQTAAAATTYSGTDLDGAIGTGNQDYARNFVIYSDCDAGGGGKTLVTKVIVVTGTDINNQTFSESITVSGIGAGGTSTTQGACAFKSIISVYVPADASGSRGYYEFGNGKKLGLSRPLTQGSIIKEFEDNAAPAAGVIALASVGLPNGTYSPDSNPDDSLDFVVYYIPN